MRTLHDAHKLLKDHIHKPEVRKHFDEPLEAPRKPQELPKAPAKAHGHPPRYVRP